MDFFLDPAIVTLPKLTETTRDEFLDFLDDMNDWAQLLSLPQHTFYVSIRCKDELYNSDRIEYPPDHTTLDRYWKHLGISEYAISDVYAACERLLDVDTLTTIEAIAAQENDPYFETYAVEVSPDAFCIRHHSEMREAIKNSLGSLTYLREMRKTETLKRLVVASCGVSEDAINVEASVYVLDRNGQVGSTQNYSTVFRVLIHPTTLNEYDDPRNLITEGLRVMVVGGHQNFFKRIETIKNDKALDLRCIGPDDDAKIASFKRILDGVDCVIEVTSYSSHKLSQIVKDALVKGIVVEHINSQGLTEFEKALVRVSERLRSKV